MDIIFNENALEEIQEEFLQQVGDEVLQRAIDTAPVLTGQYRAGLSAQLVDGEMRVGSSSEHAIYVEARTGNVVKAMDAAAQ